MVMSPENAAKNIVTLTISIVMMTKTNNQWLEEMDMMQIYVDAIVASIKTKETQYVLYHSLEYERTSDKNRVLNLLQSGWKCGGEYIDGIGYEYFKILSTEKIKPLAHYLQLKLAGEIRIVFKETYDCLANLLKLEATISCSEIKERNVVLSGEKASGLREFLLFNLGVKQDPDAIITNL